MYTIHTRATKKLLIYNTRMYYTYNAKINPHHFDGDGGGDELTARIQFVLVCHEYTITYYCSFCIKKKKNENFDRVKKKMNERIRLVGTHNTRKYTYVSRLWFAHYTAYTTQIIIKRTLVQ